MKKKLDQRRVDSNKYASIDKEVVEVYPETESTPPPPLMSCLVDRKVSEDDDVTQTEVNTSPKGSITEDECKANKSLPHISDDSKDSKLIHLRHKSSKKYEDSTLESETSKEDTDSTNQSNITSDKSSSIISDSISTGNSSCFSQLDDRDVADSTVNLAALEQQNTTRDDVSTSVAKCATSEEDSASTDAHKEEASSQDATTEHEDKLDIRKDRKIRNKVRYTLIHTHPQHTGTYTPSTHWYIHTLNTLIHTHPQHTDTYTPSIQPKKL